MSNSNTDSALVGTASLNPALDGQRMRDSALPTAKGGARMQYAELPPEGGGSAVSVAGRSKQYAELPPEQPGSHLPGMGSSSSGSSKKARSGTKKGSRHDRHTRSPRVKRPAALDKLTQRCAEAREHVEASDGIHALIPLGQALKAAQSELQSAPRFTPKTAGAPPAGAAKVDVLKHAMVRSSLAFVLACLRCDASRHKVPLAHRTTGSCTISTSSSAFWTKRTATRRTSPQQQRSTTSKNHFIGDRCELHGVWRKHEKRKPEMRLRLRLRLKLCRKWTNVTDWCG